MTIHWDWKIIGGVTDSVSQSLSKELEPNLKAKHMRRPSGLHFWYHIYNHHSHYIRQSICGKKSLVSKKIITNNLGQSPSFFQKKSGFRKVPKKIGLSTIQKLEKHIKKIPNNNWRNKNPPKKWWEKKNNNQGIPGPQPWLTQLPIPFFGTSSRR